MNTKTSTPDWMTDILVAWAEHPPLCVCQTCDPEFHIEIEMDFAEPPF